MKHDWPKEHQQRTVTQLFFGSIAQVDASKSRFTLVRVSQLSAFVYHEHTDLSALEGFEQAASS